MRDFPPISRRGALGLAAAALPSALLASGSAAAAGRSVIGGERLARSGVQVDGGAPDLPETNSLSWVVADAGSGEVLAAYNAHRRMPPASTLKMLFADTVLPKFDRSLRHRVTAEDLADIGAGSSLVGIEAGITYTVEQLWLGVFLRSGNDAVHVLCSMNGGVDRTVREMRARALELQANDTHVVSPDGYDTPGQLSSAYDLTLFARAGLRNPDFRDYCRTQVAHFPGEHGSTFEIQNTNRLLGRYQGVIGVKNGYTTNAGNTFTGAAERDGRTLLVTVMHPESGYDEVYKEAAALLDWGFGATGRVTPVGALVPPLSELKSSPTPRGGGEVSATTAAKGSGWFGPGAEAGLVALVAAFILAIRRRPRPRAVAEGGRRRAGGGNRSTGRTPERTSAPSTEHTGRRRRRPS
ncbi:D-alanyl-D-alanine carboxypeptidase family protein [Streptomyces sp. MI02-7b]|uniref:D-alanyl-D-alanine carboxypeptidase family protein n=1 Tax=Streptomyces sp. MI02-7b TaxID=462941 RepID=UPI0029A12836|nr:serine hydrolase [Streptomyces sp. MI02-7b]MDX3071941.1 serine hydrolase [Streptomyces sp. MI02-7b]